MTDLQGFLNAGGGDAGGGTFHVSAPLTMPTRSRLLNCKIVGDGIPVALIAGDGVNPLTSLHLADVEVENAGIAIRYCGDSVIERVRVIQPPATGIEVTRGYELRLTDCKVLGGLGTGILIDGAGNDQYLTRCRVVGGKTGVEIRQTGAAWLDTIGTSFCSTGLKVGCGPEVCEFLFSSRCAYDQGSGHGIRLGPNARGVRFMQDWASSNAKNGVFVEGSADVSFVQFRAYNNGWHGMQLTGSDFHVDGCTFSGNGGSNSPNYHGLVLGQVQGARVIGCRSGRVAHFANLQGFGLLVASAFSTGVVLSANDFRHNVLGGMQSQSAVTASTNIP